MKTKETIGISQRDLVRRHLSSGKTLTQAEARQVYGIERLAARVAELKKDGLPVKTMMRHDELGVKYARYTL